MAKRKRQRLPDGVTLKDVTQVFEKAMVALSRDHNVHRRFKPQDIDRIVKACLPEFTATLEELSEYIEREDWDAIVQMASQEQTRRAIRAALKMRL
jgi:chaperonin GroEL (HSP60 family)